MQDNDPRNSTCCPAINIDKNMSHLYTQWQTFAMLLFAYFFSSSNDNTWKVFFFFLRTKDVSCRLAIVS